MRRGSWERSQNANDSHNLYVGASITYQGRQYRDECQKNDDGRDALRDDAVLEDL